MWTLNIGVPISDFIVGLFERMSIEAGPTCVLDFIERLLLGWFCLPSISIV